MNRETVLQLSQYEWQVVVCELLDSPVHIEEVTNYVVKTVRPLDRRIKPRKISKINTPGRVPEGRAGYEVLRQAQVSIPGKQITRRLRQRVPKKITDGRIAKVRVKQASVRVSGKFGRGSLGVAWASKNLRIAQFIRDSGELDPSACSPWGYHPSAAFGDGY